MKTFISILRGINVGQKKVLMADLKALYENLGLKDIVTYIQSGNVIFKTDKKTGDLAVAGKIEQALYDRYKFEVPVIVRTVEEIEAVLAGNPFLKEKGISEDKLHVTFLSDKPSPARLDTLKDVSYPPDRFVVAGKEVFLHCPVSYGETKLSNKFFENKLEVTATTRNWKTVNKLAELAGSGR